MKRAYLLAALAAMLCLGLLTGCGGSSEKALEKARQYDSNGEYDKAAAQYEKYLEKAPDDLAVRYRLLESRVRAD